MSTLITPAKFAALLTIGLFALSACAGPGVGEETPDSPIPIEGIDGSWTFAGGADSTGDLSADSAVTLVISGGSVSGQGACNSYSAALTGAPTELAIGTILPTLRACESPLMEFDDRYFAALSVITVAIPTGGSLVMQGEGVTLDFLPLQLLPEG
jgi:hypothetical protein